MPALKNEDYRASVERAEHDAEARVLFDEYIPKLNSDPVQAIDLFRSHPVVQRRCSGEPQGCDYDSHTEKCDSSRVK